MDLPWLAGAQGSCNQDTGWHLGGHRLSMGRTPLWAPRPKCLTQWLSARAEISGADSGMGSPRPSAPTGHSSSYPLHSLATMENPLRPMRCWDLVILAGACPLLTQGPCLLPLPLHSLMLLSHSEHQTKAQETKQGS